MNPVFWLATGSVVSAALLAARFGAEVWLGMLGPLAVVSVTWVMIERIYRANPARLTAVMISGFAGKLLFFGAYVGLAVGVVGVRPVPFAVSFTGYFIVLHAVEALLLKRLFV
ncbi:MAG TPA: hypothetical protein VL914_06230 [Vicinamibacterales bacterium]|nr:hypothetical protein [Vicinamibacterales bacterium]